VRAFRSDTSPRSSTSSRAPGAPRHRSVPGRWPGCGLSIGQRGAPRSSTRTGTSSPARWSRPGAGLLPALVACYVARCRSTARRRGATGRSGSTPAPHAPPASTPWSIAPNCGATRARYAGSGP